MPKPPYTFVTTATAPVGAARPGFFQPVMRHNANRVELLFGAGALAAGLAWTPDVRHALALVLLGVAGMAWGIWRLLALWKRARGGAQARSTQLAAMGMVVCAGVFALGVVLMRLADGMNFIYLAFLGAALFSASERWLDRQDTPSPLRPSPPQWLLTVTDARQAVHTWRVVDGVEYLARAQVGDEVLGHVDPAAGGIVVTGIRAAKRRG